MTGKRFTINGKEIIQDKQVWCMANSEHCADVISTAMNELHKENQKLLDEKNYSERKKCEYFNKWNNAHLDNIQLRQENEQLKSNVIDLIDKKINKLKNVNEVSLIPRESVEILKELKKELLE